ncbi:putative o-succinylbenzoate--CoA ligase [Mesorhizobium metallidurans STM 2683]|uniref:Putative o-succinylbenzoate--CoA ligase n=1 Tax=Mesorhizobium metallidurans STM 2683 TaxID=1297569 RepID=M5ET92_9HYPH|nr:putative o-succinylbenzoate--CoA ligase [Mesorhizobium metallidurans STM 2683]
MQAEPHLSRRPANFHPLTPADFLARAVAVHPDRPAIAWNDRRWTYRQFGGIAARLAAWPGRQESGAGDVVSFMCSNRPEMLAAHYAVPSIGAVLNSINTRLDADTVAYILDHSGSRIVVADPGSIDIARQAGRVAGVRVVLLAESEDSGEDRLDLLAGDPGEDRFEISGVADEWQPICLNYTSGTTGRPKGVVYHHRGAYLNALGNVMALGFDRDTVYLWTLPMFHCNGWCHTWAVTAAGGLHVCLDRIDPDLVFGALKTHAVTHFSCAPVVLYMLLNHPRRPAGALEKARHGGDRRRIANQHLDRTARCAGRRPGPSLRPHRILRSGDAVRTARPPGDGERWRKGRVPGTPGRAAYHGEPSQGCRRARNAGGGRRQDHGRDPAFRQHTDGRLLSRRGGERERLLGRLVSHRRSRHRAPGRRHRDQGPVEGHHHFGR